MLFLKRREQSPKRSQSSRDGGYATVGLSLIVAIFSLVLVDSLQNQTRLFVKDSIRNRSSIDAEEAIDIFGQELYRAYILGGQRPEGGLVDKTVDTFTYRGFKLYNPGYSSGTGRKICFRREWLVDVEDPICIDLTKDLIAEVDGSSSESMVAKAFDLDDWSWSQKALAFLKTVADGLSWSQAQAQASISANAADPGLAAMAGVVNAGEDFNSEFNRDYTNYHCEAGSTTFHCVQIQFCVRSKNNCTEPRHYIQQTYIFEKLPQTEMRN